MIIADSFTYAVADSVDSPSSLFSALGVRSRDFSTDNLSKNWNAFSKEATEVVMQCRSFSAGVRSLTLVASDRRWNGESSRFSCRLGCGMILEFNALLETNSCLVARIL
jgi:hypothetical protein